VPECSQNTRLKTPDDPNRVSLEDVDKPEPISDTIVEASRDWVAFLTGTPLRIAIIIVVGLLVVALLRTIIRRTEDRVASGRTSSQRGLAKLAPPELKRALKANPASIQRRAQRARTLGSVMRSATALIVGAIVVLMVLSELGVDVAPLLASAGIVGVALGFGAQALVKDFLSGIFMMAEDQYGVGDYVDLGEVEGTVEEVGLRVTRVRAFDGTLWYVRNGEVLRVGNMTQMWARLIFDVKIDYDEDPERGLAILNEIADELTTEPEWQENVLEPPTVTGLEGLDAEGSKLRILLKTAPGMQWAVGREVRTRTKKKFDAANIALATAQIRVHDHD